MERKLNKIEIFSDRDAGMMEVYLEGVLFFEGDSYEWERYASIDLLRKLGFSVTEGEYTYE